MRRAISWMIHRSGLASPGGVSARRPSCTMRSVLLTVPVFSGQADGRQHHVGQPGGLGHEDVLHHQVLQAGQRVARVVQVRVAHGRVLAHDVHAADLVRVAVGRQRLVHDLDDGVAGLLVQRHAPEVLEPAVRLRVVHALVVGEHHRDQAGVAGALHVVLAAQRMQAAAGLADLAGDGGQRDQAARVVGAVHVLAHAHAPQDHRGPWPWRRRAPPRAASAPARRRSAPSPPGCSPSRSRAAPRSWRRARARRPGRPGLPRSPCGSAR